MISDLDFRYNHVYAQDESIRKIGMMMARGGIMELRFDRDLDYFVVFLVSMVEEDKRMDYRLEP